MAVLIETNLGDIVVDLKMDVAPMACTNFLKLCKIKYYNNCLFHTVEKDFIAQTGDPTNTGKGGHSVYFKLPGLAHKYFKDELHPAVKHNVRGTVAMASEKPNENGSQFYVTLRDEVAYLDGKHTIFGTVSEGFEVLDKMNGTMCDDRGAPFQSIRIWHTQVLDDPINDQDGLTALVPPKSPEPVRDEEFFKMEDAEDEAELAERHAVALAKSQATSLELLHDLPDADIAPPDNDIFVAKLNPVTQDGDLELIFSRFGPIKSCEIVRDWKTGDSLQYAFITFENQRDCEQAYFKMHDCVIDDRRIFVNFSQSVAKLWNKWRTKSRISGADADEASKGKGKGRGRGKGKGGGATSPERRPQARPGGGSPPRGDRGPRPDDGAREHPGPERRRSPERRRDRSRSRGRGRERQR